MRININAKTMSKKAESAAALLRVLANPARLMILCHLLDGEQSAGELWEKSSLSQSAFSQHLASLRKSKIVITRKQSQTVYYSLEDDNAVTVLETLYRLYCA